MYFVQMEQKKIISYLDFFPQWDPSHSAQGIIKKVHVLKVTDMWPPFTLLPYHPTTKPFPIIHSLYISHTAKVKISKGLNKAVQSQRHNIYDIGR